MLVVHEQTVFRFAVIVFVTIYRMTFNLVVVSQVTVLKKTFIIAVSSIWDYNVELLITCVY